MPERCSLKCSLKGKSRQRHVLSAKKRCVHGCVTRYTGIRTLAYLGTSYVRTTWLIAFVVGCLLQIRNPLNALGFAIEEVINNPASIVEHAGTMQQCNKHILSVITNMLDLSKLSEGRMVVKKEVFDLCECVKSIDMICR